MKRIFAALAAVMISASLAACASDSYTMLNYETKDRMNAALSFEMRGIPTLESDDEKSYGAQDKQLGEIVYAVETESGVGARLTFRMATPKYAEKYSAQTGTPGIAGIAAESTLQTERLGSSEVTYYTNGSTVFAVWEFDGYAFSAALRFSEGDPLPGYEDIYPFVIAFIASR